jgi:low affinity Fe/Cu permease
LQEQELFTEQQNGVLSRVWGRVVAMVVAVVAVVLAGASF